MAVKNQYACKCFKTLMEYCWSLILVVEICNTLYFPAQEEIYTPSYENSENFRSVYTFKLDTDSTWLVLFFVVMEGRKH